MDKTIYSIDIIKHLLLCVDKANYDHLNTDEYIIVDRYIREGRNFLNQYLLDMFDVLKPEHFKD